MKIIKTNRKRNGSSITALTANNDFGNYVNFIKIARDNAVTDGMGQLQVCGICL